MRNESKTYYICIDREIPPSGLTDINNYNSICIELTNWGLYNFKYMGFANV